MNNEDTVLERIARIEGDLKNAQEGNRVFRDEMRHELLEIRRQNESIHEIATSVKLIAQDLQGLKVDVKEVKDDQKVLHKSMDGEIKAIHAKHGELNDIIKKVDGKEAKKVAKIWEGVRDKMLWLVVGAIATYVLYQVLPVLK